MNKKGFTLIEILAAIVILGIVGTIGISAISNSIMDSRGSVFTNLAREIVNSARGMRGQDKLPRDIKDGEAFIIPCDKTTGSTVDLTGGTGYGNLLYNYCYVGIVNNKQNYYYYITMLDDTGHSFVSLISDDIDKDKIIADENVVVTQNVGDLSGVLSAFRVVYGGSTYRIKSARVMYTAKKSGSTADSTLYGYYSNDGSSSSSSQINADLQNYDNRLLGNTPIAFNGSNYTVSKTEVMYIILSK